MSEDAAGAQVDAPEHEGRVIELCILLACFAGRSQAAKSRRRLDKLIAQSGAAILDQVVVKVSSRRRALVYDPGRTLGGTLTPALTWGWVPSTMLCHGERRLLGVTRLDAEPSRRSVRAPI